MVRKDKDGEFVIDLPAEIMKTKKGLSLTVTGKLMQNVNDYLSKQFHVQGGFVFDSTNYSDGVEQSMRQSWPARLR
jgi:hypothetical protein